MNIVENFQDKMLTIGKAKSNRYPQYVTHALSISSKEDLRDRMSQFFSHIVQYMLDVIFGCIYNMDRKYIAYLNYFHWHKVSAPYI